MFESWKRKVVPQPEDTPAEVEKKKNRIAGAAGVAALGALGAVVANQADVVDLHTDTQPKQEQKMTAADLHKLQERGPHGVMVSANPEAGVATVTMRPPGDEKPVSIDLHQPVTSIDPSVPVTEMKAPE
jgi:hypothetical protein